MRQQICLYGIFLAQQLNAAIVISFMCYVNIIFNKRLTRTVNFSVKVSLHVSSSTLTSDLGQIVSFRGWEHVTGVQVYGSTTLTAYVEYEMIHMLGHRELELPLARVFGITLDITHIKIHYERDADTASCVAIRERLGCISGWVIYSC